jgi:hypothetical protein
MESTLRKPALVAAAHSKRTGPLVAVVRDLTKTTTKAKTIIYWIVTALFCLQISFTAYAQLRLPEVAEAFNHLGFPAYFRVELSWAKLLGVVLFACAGAGAAQRMGLRRLRHRPRLGADRAPLCGRRSGGVGLGGGNRRALGVVVLLLATPAIMGEPQECECFRLPLPALPLPGRRKVPEQRLRQKGNSISLVNFHSSLSAAGGCRTTLRWQPYHLP